MNIQELQQPAVRQWIEEHAHDEPARLMLQAQLYPHIPMREAVQQLQARQKARYKLPHWYANQGVLMPPPLSVEQASSEETARYKASLVWERMPEQEKSAAVAGTLADLTGGMGLDSWAFSRHFSNVYYVEQQEELSSLAAYNFKQLNCTNVQVHGEQAATFLQQQQQPLDVLYLDPARRDAARNKVVLLSDCQPNVVSMLPLLLQKGRQVWVKASPMLDIKGAMQELGQQVQEVQVVSLRGEVKELLFCIEAAQQPDPQITAVNLTAAGEAESFCFRYSEESTAAPAISMPQAYLYDPGAALRKAGAFKLPAVRFAMQKLHPHSHLYTSREQLNNFPGRSFRMLGLVKADKKAVRKLLPGGRAHLVVRNFPQKAELLQKKLGLEEGDPLYLFATTLADGKPQLLLCERI
ncbi:RsmD family RNA methyltransferase [Cesiribacter sp. SM1]|uniref:THUMP-like domain-containing protein n=1 Tax=Cesiribacter sp. SM1 TaxID=2861196 RepID=UPI001CD2F277|nr:RsmD family RNA methyltransferase [Cesiribacter sp. SM1]